MGDGVNVTNNKCNFFANFDSYGKNKTECDEGQSEFNEDLKLLEGIRHRVGEAIVSGRGKKVIDNLKMKLNAAAKPIENKFESRLHDCHEEDDIAACGYINAYDHYVELTGPLSLWESPAGPPRSADLKLHNLGSLVIDLDVKQPWEVLLDTGAEYPAFSVAFKNKFTSFASKKGYEEPFTPIRKKKGSDDELDENEIHRIKKIKLKIDGQYYRPSIGFVSRLVDDTGGVEAEHSLVSIIGMDYLIGQSFEVDYDDSKLFFDVDVRQRLSNGIWFQIPLTLNQGPQFSYSFSMEVYINGNATILLFDTGAESTSIFENCIDKSEGAVVKGKSTIVTAYDENTDVIEDASIDLGEQTLVKNLGVVGDTNHFRNKHEESGACGLLGTDVLNHFDYIFDPDTLSLYLRERENEPNLEDELYLGAEFIKTEEGALLEAIKEDSMFAAAGLKDGDIIITIGDVEIACTGNLGVRDVLQSKTPNVPVEYKRGGKIYKTLLREEK